MCQKVLKLVLCIMSAGCYMCAPPKAPQETNIQYTEAQIRSFLKELDDVKKRVKAARVELCKYGNITDTLEQIDAEREQQAKNMAAMESLENDKRRQIGQSERDKRKNIIRQAVLLQLESSELNERSVYEAEEEKEFERIEDNYNIALAKQQKRAQRMLEGLQRIEEERRAQSVLGLDFLSPSKKVRAGDGSRVVGVQAGDDDTYSSPTNGSSQMPIQDLTDLRDASSNSRFRDNA